MSNTKSELLGDTSNKIGILTEISPTKYITGSKFNEATFNADFLKIIDEQEILANKNEQQKLNIINNYYINKMEYQSDKIPIENMSIQQLLLNWLSSLKNIYTDILNVNINRNILIKEDRLFYIGLTFIIIGIIGYIYNNYIQIIGIKD